MTLAKTGAIFVTATAAADTIDTLHFSSVHVKHLSALSEKSMPNSKDRSLQLLDPSPLPSLSYDGICRYTMPN